METLAHLPRAYVPNFRKHKAGSDWTGRIGTSFCRRRSTYLLHSCQATVINGYVFLRFHIDVVHCYDLERLRGLLLFSLTCCRFVHCNQTLYQARRLGSVWSRSQTPSSRTTVPLGRPQPPACGTRQRIRSLCVFLTLVHLQPFSFIQAKPSSL